VRKAIDDAPEKGAVNVLVRYVLAAELDAIELDALRRYVAERAKEGLLAIRQQLKAALEQQRRLREREERDRRIAERRDPRPQIPAPPENAEWLPQMQALNDVLGAARDLEPPARDNDGFVVQVCVRRLPKMHALTALGVNEGDTEETRLPPPEQPLLTRLDEPQLAEMIERHIEYVDPADRSVHLAKAFVRHFQRRSDDALPVMAAIATLPIVLGDRTLLTGRGLDRERGIVFRVPKELEAMLPQPDDCTSTAVAEAMQFLTDEWLRDVATDYVGKCILISAALSIIERSLLPDRPVFFVTAGRRGSGKTTTLIMLLMAVTGIRPAAAAWSPNEEERRKALLAYLMEAICAIIWDNIQRGARISCPHIEKACTTEWYSDRRLGVSEIMVAAATAIQMFTGNNIGPKGDLASRALTARLEVDRADPENRAFRHPDPVAWTEANRGKILAALYTILLGNPALRPGWNGAPQTRFKAWWRLVGSAVEHAAQQHAGHVAALTMDPLGACPPQEISFRELFVTQEQDDEESASLADALNALGCQWPKETTFKAADLAKLINDQSEYRSSVQIERSATVREFLFSERPQNQDVTAKAVGKRLKRHIGDPVRYGAITLILKECRDLHGGANGAWSFYVQGR
jgi:hypothetical protein